jgi:hypothetical protein
MERPADRIALIECFERDGRPGRTHDVPAWPLTLGRSLANQVVLDDPFVAAQHARIAADADGRLTLEVLDTANGVQLDGRHLAAGARWALPAGGATLQLGQTRLRLRLAGETLAPERPLPPRQAATLRLALQAAALLLLSVAGLALRMDPGADSSAWLTGLLFLPAALGLWCAAWALLSKLFQHRFDFMGHLRTALPWVLAIELCAPLLQQAGASLGWPLPWRAAPLLQALLALLWLHAHLVLVLPLHRRAVATAVAAMGMVAGGITLNGSYRSTDSFSRAPYMSSLPLPMLRLGATSSTQSLVAEMAGLGPALATRAKAARQEDRDNGAAGDDAGEGDDGKSAGR